MRWRERDGVRWLEAALPGARAAFTTRVGGHGAGDFASLNLGLYTEDEPATVLANRASLTAALERDAAGILFGHQVHEAQVLRRDREADPNPWTEPDARPPQADGQATSAAGLTPLVQVADCLPVIVAGPGGVAALHCGWRGLAGGILAAGAAEVDAEAAAIGPGIGSCCYEVGEEVLGHFSALGEGVSEGRMLDLAEVARRMLAGAGVEAIETAGICTSCEPELFFSHRRDRGRTGRQAGLGWIDHA
jgi:YfiH family protein